MIHQPLSQRIARAETLRPRSSLESIFVEEPVSLDVFVQDKKFLHNPPLSIEQYRLVQHIERVYMPETLELMAVEFGGYWDMTRYLRMVNLITAQWGKGGGKDHTVRVAVLRVIYLLLCLKSPQQYFEMPEQDFIHLLNIASNSGQANRAFFKPMTLAVKRGWFRDYADPKQGEIEFAKNVTAISGHSDADAQEGLNILIGVADEIDAFKSKDEMVGTGKRAREASTSAESILDMLKTSASTRFPDVYKRVAISFPRYLGSTIQRLTAEGRADIELMGDASKEYVSGPFATWDVNPRVKGKEKYAEDYRKDPLAAAAKYECKPSRAVDAYFRNPQIFRQSIYRDNQPLSVTYEVREYRSTITGEVTQGWEPVYHFSPDLYPVEGARYAMHGDLAIKGDRAGIAMSHIQRYEERVEKLFDEDGALIGESDVVVPIVKNDFVIAFSADAAAKPVAREIQIRWAQELAFELTKRGFFVARYTFDGFQSADTIQVLTRHGILSEKFSLDIKDDGWKTLKDVASQDRLKMPFDQLLFLELEALSRIGNGKVDHPPGGSKDMADALAGSVTGAIFVGGEEDADSKQVESNGTVVDFGEVFEPYAGMSVGALGTPAGMRGFSDGWY